MPSCTVCDLPIVSSIASYENRYYHPDCLTCSKCVQTLSGKKFIKGKLGDLICEDCNSKTAPRCKRCSQMFESGKPYKKLSEDTFYHNECFRCCGPCKKPIGAEFYDIENDKFLCVECYDKYGSDYEKYVNDDDDLLNRPPPPLPLSTPPKKDDSNVNNLSNNFQTSLNIEVKPPEGRELNNNSTVKVEMLPAFERDRSDNDKPAPVKPQPDKKSSEYICAKCNKEITGTFTVYNENKYHTKCFVCCQCNQEFKEKTFFKLNGNPLCRQCHSQNLVDKASRCRKCYQPILDTLVTFKGGEFHDYCLVCNMCEKKLVGQSIYTDKQENPFCVDCFTKKEAKTCAKCLKLIAPNHTNLVFENKNYHKECFCCSKCNRIISSAESFYKGDSAPDAVTCASCI